MYFSEEDNIKATLLYNLRRKRKIGNKHTPFDTLGKGFQSHLRGDVKKIAKKLIKEGFLLSKPTSYGLQISLNRNKLEKIDNFIKNVLGLEF